MTIRSGQLDWLLVEFVRDTPGVANAIVVSGDGLRLATSPGVTVALGDQLAAAASGLAGLAAGASRLLASGAVTQTVLEMEGGYLLVGAIGTAGLLAVHTDRHCDLGVVGYESALLAARVGHSLEPGIR
jgi:predicted regulator of Ras-like GTPase activity (Roadblock/LC7/MglB family)